MATDSRPPQRIQLRRTKGWRKPEGAKVVARPSDWGNPFKIGDPFRFVGYGGGLCVGVVSSRQTAVRLFREFLDCRPDLQVKVRAELAGKDLCCWCPEDAECHADVLLAIANGGAR